MFKPVTDAEKANFDAETVAMYSRRPSDPKLTDMLLNMPRPQRKHLPVVAGPEHTNKKFTESAMFFPVAFLGAGAFYIYAANQFSKIYFPYGIVLRRSIPQTWQQYVSYRLPICVFFLGMWYYQKEWPRKQKLDLTCESERY